jgi:uncharacterized glyoxalase superfamily metalloenzyme YdcJ
MELYRDLVGQDASVWAAKVPATEEGLREAGLAWFTSDGAPIVYEDFLPRSAAGIFRSNLTGSGSRADHENGVARDRAWMAEQLGRTVHDPQDLYAAQAAVA